MNTRPDLDWSFFQRPHELAEELRKRHGITTYPVPVAVIAEAEGAIIKYVPMASEGALTRTPSGYILQVNESAIVTRRRYTIAHEVGHILCDRLTDSYPGTRFRTNSPVGIREEERFCQRFAACLLIPDATIAEFTQWEQLSIWKLHEKARHLQVSAQALLWRVLEQLPYEGGAMCFRIMGKPTASDDLKLRVDWSLFPKTKKTYIARYDAVPFNSPIHRALQHTREAFHEGIHLDFGSLRGKHNLLVKSSRQVVLAIVVPTEVDPTAFRCAFQTTTDES